MSLSLPSVRVFSQTGAVVGSRGDLLRKAEEASLVGLDTGRAADTSVPGDRLVPLSARRVAVGRGLADGAVWRIMDCSEERVANAAMLWGQDAWFHDESGEEGPEPRALSLRELLARATPVAGNAERLHQTLVAAIAALRREERVAVVGPVAALSAPIHAGRWFMLSLLLCLPDDLASRIRISALEPSPDPDHWDLVVVSAPVEGFTTIDTSSPPKAGDDPMALFVADRLEHGDPETLEASSELPDAGLEMWTGAFETMAQTGDYEAIDPRLFDSNPSLATWVIIGKLDEGAPLSRSLANEIAEATARVGDARIWEVVAERPKHERSLAISSFLAVEPLPAPSEEMLRALARSRPVGHASAPWAHALIGWLNQGVAPSLTESLLRDALAEEDSLFDPISRSSVFAEYLVSLLTQERTGEVLSQLFGPTSRTLVSQIGAGPLVIGWLALPVENRTISGLQQLVDLVAGAPDSDDAAARLYRGLLAQQRLKRAEWVVQRWARKALTHTQKADDALLAEIKGSDNAFEWVRVVAPQAESDAVMAAVRGVTRSRADDLWRVALTERAVHQELEGRSRLLLVKEFLPDGDEALEPEARSLFAAAMPEITFPDPELADLGAQLAEVHTATPLWMWVAITASSKDQFDDATVGATIDTFFARPPREALVRDASLRCTAGLAEAHGWDPFDHATWLVRMIMAPDDGSEFHLHQAERLCEALCQRGDGPERMAEVTNAFVELPPDHPALLVFLHRLLPGVFGGAAPPVYVARVDEDRMDPRIRTIWKESVKMQRNPLGRFRRD